LKPIRLVLTYARRYSLALTITTISMILLVGVQLLIPWIIKTLIAAITNPAATPNSMQFITQMTLVVFLIYVARAILQAGGWWLMYVNLFTNRCSVSPCGSTRTSKPAN
jgi:ATP-binding cassette subfamily B protein